MSRFCDECGARLAQSEALADVLPAASVPIDYMPPPTADVIQRPVSVTSIGVPPIEVEAASVPSTNSSPDVVGVAHAMMVIERGDGPGTEFKLINNESIIGRWDADNGVFPDVDLDAFDNDAKVSRRHAKIYRNNSVYFIEDLGSTNGTYVNRGRRLLPGNPQVLSDGDEVIVGKTFLRFHIV
jgi:hypothetical protein